MTTMLVLAIVGLGTKQVQASYGLGLECREGDNLKDGEVVQELDSYDVSKGKTVSLGLPSTNFYYLVHAFFTDEELRQVTTDTDDHQITSVPGLSITKYLDDNLVSVGDVDDSVVKMVFDMENSTVAISSTQYGVVETSPTTVEKIVYSTTYRRGMSTEEVADCYRYPFKVSFKYDKPLTQISSLNLTVERPLYGDTVTVTDNVQSPIPVVTLESDNVTLATDNVTYKSAVWKSDVSTINTPLFAGTFKDDSDYYAIVTILPDEGYTFGNLSSVNVAVKGGVVHAKYLDGSNARALMVYAKIVPQELYTVTDNSGSAIATFASEKDHDFTLIFNDVLKMTAEELEDVYGLTAEEFGAVKDSISSSLKKYGVLLGLYEITISDGTSDFSGALTLKIKLTEAMKKYDKLRLIYLDAENHFVVGDVKDLTIGSATADVDLDYLSVYALVGVEEETVEQTESKNPKTGDRTGFYLLLSILGTLCLLGTSIYIRKNRFN